MSDNQSAAAATVPYQPAAAAPPPALSPDAGDGSSLLVMIERLATNPQLNVEVFDRLLAARRSEEDREGERAFNSAMSLAKGELGPVLKTHEVDFTSARTQTRTRYKYESFADVARAVDPVFARHGLSYRFSVAQQGKQVTVTCIVSHADGYSERTKLEGEADPGSTGMSTVQALGSALTYLQRYSLRAAIGLAAAIDDDGRSASGPAPQIDAAQAAELRKLFDVTGRSVSMVLKLTGAEEIDTMTVDQWTRAMDVLSLTQTEQARRKNAPANDNA